MFCRIIGGALQLYLDFNIPIGVPSSFKVELWNPFFLCDSRGTSTCWYDMLHCSSKFVLTSGVCLYMPMVLVICHDPAVCVIKQPSPPIRIEVYRPPFSLLVLGILLSWCQDSVKDRLIVKVGSECAVEKCYGDMQTFRLSFLSILCVDLKNKWTMLSLISLWSIAIYSRFG